MNHSLKGDFLKDIYCMKIKPVGMYNVLWVHKLTFYNLTNKGLMTFLDIHKMYDKIKKIEGKGYMVKLNFGVSEKCIQLKLICWLVIFNNILKWIKKTASN